MPTESPRDAIEADGALNQLLERASTDHAFRQRCLSAPHEVVAEMTGLDVPDDFVIRFVENEGADMTVVLPDLVVAEDELSDDDLDLAAGGTMWWGGGP